MSLFALAFLTRSVVNSPSLLNNYHRMQQENAPTFISEEDMDRFDLKERYLNVFTSTDQTINAATDRSTREYYHCAITMTDCSISKSFAFGTGLSVSAGGAIFISSSTLVIKGTANSKSLYQDNMAGTGGAIAGIDCPVSIDTSQFDLNKAYKFAGAIYLSAVVNIEVDNVKVNRYEFADTQCYIMNTIFTSNAATELGGAVFLQLFGTTYLEKCTFTTNKAGHSGGAAFIAKTEPQFFECTFAGNHAGNRTTVMDKSLFKTIDLGSGKNFNQIPNKRDVHRGGLARSGGAISFNVIEFGPKESNQSPFPTNHPQPSWDITGGTRRFQMTTTGCCFINNRAFNEDGVINEGCAVHLAGPVSYHSLDDHFDLDEIKMVSINKLIVDNAETDADKEKLKATYIIFGFNKDAEGKCSGGSAVAPGVFDKGDPPKITAEFTRSYDVEVPLPTSFIYEATPLTRLPYATTRSHKYTESLTEKTFTIAKPKTKSLPATFSASPSCSQSATPVPTKSNDPLFPTQTASLSVSPTPSPSDSPTVSMSPFPTVSPKPTPSRSTGKFSRRTNVLTDSPILVETEVWISGYSFTVTKGEYGEEYTSITYGDFPPWKSNTTAITYTEVYTSYLDYGESDFNMQEGTSSDPGQSNLLPIIIGAVAGILLIIIAAILIWFFVFRTSGSDSSDSCVEMAEETVLQVPDSTSAPITNDNPLWTTSVMGDTDDPFRNDFEEEAMEGFFNVRNQSIE